MAVNSVIAPYPSFFEADGTPLEAGYIYIGQPGLDAETSPKAAFFDIAMTISTGPFVRTAGGYPVRSGSAAAVYVNGDFSMTVRDRNGVLVFSAPYRSFAFAGDAGASSSILAPDGSFSAAGFGFINEIDTGFVRQGAGVMQSIVGGQLIWQQTGSAVTFIKPLNDPALVRPALTAPTLSTEATLVAGTDAQGQGLITGDLVVVITTAANPSGVTLPTALAGRWITVVNRGTNPINVYPALGAAIDAGAANAPVQIAVGAGATFSAKTTTAWESSVQLSGVAFDARSLLNLSSAFSGAAGAPRLQLEALPELTPGLVIRSRNDAIVSAAATTTITTFALGFGQSGTVRATLEHSGGTGGGVPEVRVVRSRAGSETTLITWTNPSATYVARSVDVSVIPGDTISVRAIGGSAAASSVKNCRIQTNGERLWPFAADVIVEN